MKFQDLLVFKNDRYSLGRELTSGRFYLSIPVFNGFAEYEEFYEISNEEFENLSKDNNQSQKFAEDCRNRQMDTRLIIKPGPADIRGSAI